MTSLNLEKLEYGAKVHLFKQMNLKGETNKLYRLITRKVRYFKPLLVIMMIMSYRYENLSQYSNFEFGVFIR